MSNWYNPRVTGYLALIISDQDPRPVADQIKTNYAHGGGYHPFSGFELVETGDEYALQYPGDPLLRERARTNIREETVVLFDYSWVAVIQPDGSHVVVRMD